MSCNECSAVDTISTGPALVFSDSKSSNNGEVFALTPANIIQVSPLLKRIRVSTTVQHLVGGGSIIPILQTTEDGVAWSEPIPVTESMTTNGTSTSVWFDDENKFKRGIRIGVLVSSGKNGSLTLAYVNQVIDIHKH